MKMFVRVLCVSCMVGSMFLAAGSASAAGAFKIGGGIYFEETTPGGHISIDIPVGEGSFMISPFADLFHKSELKLYSGGVNILMKKPAGESGQIYYGVGGGFSKVEVTDQGVSVSKTEAMANGVLGFEFSVSDRAAIFLQGKYIATFGDIKARNGAVTAGIAFGFGE
jgi:hypothetical protein